MENCPTGAITKSDEGWTSVNIDECIGCGVCVNTCKYGAVKLAEIAIICNQCMGDPMCVKRCPTGALDYSESPESMETPSIVFERLREEWSLE